MPSAKQTEPSRQQRKLINLANHKHLFALFYPNSSSNKANKLRMHQSSGLVHSLRTWGIGFRENTRTVPEYRPSAMLLSTHRGVASLKAGRCADNCAPTKEKLATYAASISISPGENKREKQKSAE